MTPHEHQHQPERVPAGDDELPAKEHGRPGHHWLMIACCIPMLAIAGAIALSGAGIGFFVVAVMCTAMMAFMMAGISGKKGGGH